MASPKLFERIAGDMIAEGRAEEGTMMGHPCLRVEGEFFAGFGKDDQIILKLSEARVGELIDDGVGVPFAPNGRIFREWVAVPRDRSRRWRKLMNEARDFVSG